MNSKIKDPRHALIVWFRMSILTLIISPYVYLNLREDNINKLIIFFIIWIIIFLLLRKFDKTDEEDKLHNVVGVGYMFGITWLLFALMFSIGIASDYFKLNVSPPFISVIIIGALLFFSFILFYLSFKSTKYEKTELGYKSTFSQVLIGFLIMIFLIILAIIIMRVFIGF